VPIDQRKRDAQALLKALGFDGERYNERSALVLLALLHLGPDDEWATASSPLLGTRAIMDWIADPYGLIYRANTRETIRRSTLHQFVEAGLVEENPDDPLRPINSPKWCYQVQSGALAVIRTYGTERFEQEVAAYLDAVPGLRAKYAAARELSRIPITLPGGETVLLSAGGQNALIRQMVDDFCSFFTPGGQLLYIGDADSKWAVFEEEALAALGVTVDQHGKMPDLIVYLPGRQWIVLLEAASSHGPVTAQRRAELGRLFQGATAGLVYVSCFPSRTEMRRYLAEIAWESEVWCADNPTHLIHFNGERFLGPYA